MNAPRHHHPRITAALVAASALIVTVSLFAQAQPPAQPATAATVDQTLSRKYLTAARNALSDVTELPAASQLTGDARTRVQQLITDFNELITKTSDWRASYDKVEASLASLLAQEPAGATGTPGAVGTSGTTTAVDPAIRAKLVEFGTHLEQFKAAAGGAIAPSEPTPATATPTEPTPATATATAAPPDTPPATPPTTTAAAVEHPDNPPVDPAVESAQESADVVRDIVLHVEAIEVILGAQANAQKAATAAAGGVVTTTDTPSGSTRTTITNPNVTLSAIQLDDIKTHLSEIRRLVENKK